MNQPRYTQAPPARKPGQARWRKPLGLAIVLAGLVIFGVEMFEPMAALAADTGSSLTRP